MSEQTTPATGPDGWWHRLVRRIGFGARPGRSPFERGRSPQTPVQQEVSLPSATDDISFRMSLEVFWAGDVDQRGSGGLDAAVEGVVRRASGVSALVSPLDADRLQRQLSLRLSEPGPVAEESGIWAFARVLDVGVAEEDLEEEKKLRELRRAQSRAAIERETELAEITYLRENIFCDLGRAAVWWLRCEDYAFERLPEHLPLLDRMVTTVRGDGAQETASDALIDAVRALFEDDVSQQFSVIRVLYESLLERGREDEARELVERGRPHIKALTALEPGERGRLPSPADNGTNGHAGSWNRAAEAVEPSELESRLDA